MAPKAKIQKINKTARSWEVAGESGVSAVCMLRKWGKELQWAQAAKCLMHRSECASSAEHFRMGWREQMVLLGSGVLI